MKKKALFLMTLICLFLISGEVSAKEVEFYEAEKLNGIYTKSVRSDVSHFQRARFFRRKNDNKAAYCIEPFIFFDEEKIYTSSNTPSNIDNNTWKRMSLIAHYGYGYHNHTDEKWYAITQLLIWQEADKGNDFYFTDGLNGNKINIFTSEIQEINNLVEQHQKLPSIYNKTITIKKGTKYIYDENDSIKYFKSTDNLVTISGNKIDISSLNEGSYRLVFERILDTSDEPTIFYYNPDSQNLMTAGNLDNDKFTLTLNIYDTELKITKVDKDTNDSKSQGEAKLCDAIFELYDSNNNLVKQFSLDNNCEAVINNLDLGKYYIKEKQAGDGYILDTKLYEVNLNLLNSRVNFQIANKVIEKNVKIHKDFETKYSKESEENVVFDIYSDNKYIDSITTDKNGDGSIKLPYGKYTVKQVTTTYGYSPVDDFSVVVDGSPNELTYNLVDKLIEKEVKIHKDYGTSKIKTAESNIVFDIYSNNQYIDSITTDKNGDGSIKLPYGKYTVKQITTTEGYSSIDDFDILIDENSNNPTYNLMDYLIEVPNTRSDDTYTYLYIVLFINFIGLGYVKKKCID